MRKRVFTYALGLSLLLCGCASSHAPPAATAHSVPGGAVAITRSAGAVAVPYAPSGTIFNATLDHPLDTRVSETGEPISATVTAPVVASNGDVVVPAGAKLEGRVANVRHVPGPGIDLAFDTLVLPSGRVPVSLRVLSAQETRSRTVLAPTGATSMQGGATQRQGEPRATPVGSTQITIPSGATLRMALTSPIVDVRSIH